MPSIEIDLWLQELLEYHLREHVLNLVKKREGLDDSAHVGIYGFGHSYGRVEVVWAGQTDPRSPYSRIQGTESFTLAEILKICMTGEKETT